MSDRPLSAAMAEVAVILAAAGDVTPHAEGPEVLHDNEPGPPRYTWIDLQHAPAPDGTDRQEKNKQRHDIIFARDEQAEIHCWAFDKVNEAAADASSKHRDAAYLMGANVLAGLQRAAKADVTPGVCKFLNAGDRGWMGYGAVYVVPIVFRSTPVRSEIRTVPAGGVPAASVAKPSVVVTGTQTQAEADMTSSVVQVEP